MLYLWQRRGLCGAVHSGCCRDACRMRDRTHWLAGRKVSAGPPVARGCRSLLCFQPPLPHNRSSLQADLEQDGLASWGHCDGVRA